MRRLFIISMIIAMLLPLGLPTVAAAAAAPNGGPKAHTTWRLKPGAATSGPTGLTPSQIRGAYGLPSTGGSGTIAIIDAYDNLDIQNDLATFSSTFGLPAPDSSNFEIHQMGSVSGDTGWGLEIALDVEWAHAIAPNAKILLVEAASNSFSDLLNAVDYARGRSDVVAISMSWGANEFSSETGYDHYFTSSYKAVFFASSGDSGSKVIWPSSSPNVVAVGGTTLTLNSDNTVASETGWSGSGGGVSRYEAEPSYQSTYGIPGAGGHRGVPDVSYDADPNTGVSVYDTYGYGGWLVVGGTSAGAPQWAAIQSLGGSASNPNFYQDAASSSYSTYFRDITTGSSGRYSATTGYDYVTGLGSPLKTVFSPSTTGDFSISASPTSFNLSPGDTATSTVTVSSLNGFNSSVSLSAAGPTGWSFSFAPSAVTPAAGGSTTSSMTITVPSDAAAASYTISVTGTSGSLTHSTSIAVTVTASTTGTGDFSISASPSKRNVKGTGTASYTVTLTSINGYDSSVDLSVTSSPSLPSDWAYSFSPSSVLPTASGATSTLTVDVNSRQRNSYTLTISATDGSIAHTTSVTLTDR